MSSNTPLMDSTEDNSQEETMAKTKVPSEDKSGSDLTDRVRIGVSYKVHAKIYKTDKQQK